MAMIKCSECGADFSDKASGCPKCGNPQAVAIPAGVQPSRFCRTCGKSVNAQAVACTSCGCPPMTTGRFCYGCGTEVQSQAIVCVKCGVSLTSVPSAHGAAGVSSGPAQPANKFVCAILAFVLPFGIHRFLMGYNTEGIIQALLAIFCLVGIFWSWVDGIMILTGSLRMKDGRELAA